MRAWETSPSIASWSRATPPCRWSPTQRRVLHKSFEKSPRFQVFRQVDPSSTQLQDGQAQSLASVASGGSLRSGGLPEVVPTSGGRFGDAGKASGADAALPRLTYLEC